jgi:sensor histidine kinase YesM
MQYKNMTMPIKQMLGYLVGILMLTILFSLSIVHFGTLISDYNETMRDAWRQLNTIQDMRAYCLQARLNMESNPAGAKSDIKLMEFNFFSLLQGTKSGLPQDVMLLTQDMLAFSKQTQELIDLQQQGGSAEALVIQRERFNRAYYFLLGRLYVEIEKAKTHAAMAETSFLQRISYLLFLNTVLAPLSFAFLYAYGFFLSNYTGVRLNKFMYSLKEILAGNYKTRVADDSRDELGQIAQVINELTRRLESEQVASGRGKEVK